MPGQYRSKDDIAAAWFVVGLCGAAHLAVEVFVEKHLKAPISVHRSTIQHTMHDLQAKQLLGVYSEHK